MILRIISLCFYVFTSLAFATINKVDEIGGYGKLGIILIAQDTDVSIENSGSRVGLFANKKINETYRAYAQAEWFFNAVNNTSDVSIGENYNFVSQADSENTFSRRLGYIGFDLKKWGDIRIGKQWSVYSDVSHYTDAFNLYGGSAGGTYNVNTDGGQSGTGRVSKGITYRVEFWGMKLGLQAKLIQNTKIEINDDEQDVIAKDGFGFSWRVPFYKFEFGLAYNQLELEGEKDSVNGYGGGNNWSSVIGLKYSGEIITIAAIYNRSKDHELDDQGFIYDGEGQEIFIQIKLGESYILKTGYNHLESFDNDLTGPYKREYYILGLSHESIKDVKFFGEYRQNESRNYLDEKGDNGFGLGVVLAF